MTPEKRKMTRRERRILEGFANDYARMMERVERRVEKFTDAQLAELIAAADTVSDTNCWVWTYYAAPVAKEAAQYELRVREGRKGETK